MELFNECYGDFGAVLIKKHFLEVAVYTVGTYGCSSLFVSVIKRAEFCAFVECDLFDDRDLVSLVVDGGVFFFPGGFAVAEEIERAGVGHAGAVLLSISYIHVQPPDVELVFCVEHVFEVNPSFLVGGEFLDLLEEFLVCSAEK